MQSTIVLPFEKTLESDTSKKTKFDFLKTTSKEFAKTGEEIAITDRLAAYLQLLDAWWDEFQAMLARNEQDFSISSKLIHSGFPL